MIDKKFLLGIGLSVSLLLADTLDFETSGSKGTKTAQIIDGRKVYRFSKNLEEIVNSYSLQLQNLYHLPNKLQFTRQGKEVYSQAIISKNTDFIFNKSDLKAKDRIELYTSENFKILDIEIVDKDDLEFEIAHREPEATQMPHKDATVNVSKRAVPMFKIDDVNESNKSDLVVEMTGREPTPHADNTPADNTPLIGLDYK